MGSSFICVTIHPLTCVATWSDTLVSFFLDADMSGEAFVAKSELVDTN
jgi:hypothetical protein